jgi:hypothetical protein
VLEGMSHSFTSERRPGRTCHALSAIALSHGASRATTYHSDHFVQHRAGLRGCPEVRCGRCRCSLPPRKRSVFGQGTRSDPPTPTPWRSSYLRAPKRAPTDCQLPFLPQPTPEMAARLSVARAARQLTSAAARRPAPFVCQRGQLQAQKQRLFSVSAACMSKKQFTRKGARVLIRRSEGEAVHRGP